jgi:hypothetical protein
MRKEDNPCYGCEKPKRHEGCHDTCTERLEYKKRYDAEKAFINDGKRKNNDLFCAKIDGIKRMQNKRSNWHTDGQR